METREKARGKDGGMEICPASAAGRRKKYSSPVSARRRRIGTKRKTEGRQTLRVAAQPRKPEVLLGIFGVRCDSLALRRMLRMRIRMRMEGNQLRMTGHVFMQ